MRKLILSLSIVALLGVTFVDIAEAHSGRTDKNGCHRDRKAGTRHCH